MTHLAGAREDRSASWPQLTLREKRVRLVEESLAALVAEARRLGIRPSELLKRIQPCEGRQR
jgi:hypothetical protein